MRELGYEDKSALSYLTQLSFAVILANRFYAKSKQGKVNEQEIEGGEAKMRERRD